MFNASFLWIMFDASFHGEWGQISADVLWIMFNCRGPLDEHGAKLSLKGTYAFKQPADAEHPMPYYVGRDAARRPVKLVPYGPWWELRMVEGELLWCLLVYALEALRRAEFYPVPYP